jgi:enoyl-CoA hydratase/carnithine racemase
MAKINLGSEHLRGNLDSGVLTVVLDRPERKNACTLEMYRGIKNAALIAENDPAIDVLVVTGSGDVFCPGGDMGGQGDAKFDGETDWDLTPFVQLERCPKIVLAAVNGLCQGGGLGMVVMSDISIASDRARFRAPELLRGIADAGYAAYLPAQIGVANARDLLLTGRTLDAEEARRMGLVTRVVPHELLREEAIVAAESILRTAPEARLHVKRILNDRYGRVDRMTMDWSLFRGPEAREGMRAFAEKRAPDWVPEALRTGKRP